MAPAPAAAGSGAAAAQAVAAAVPKPDVVKTAAAAAGSETAGETSGGILNQKWVYAAVAAGLVAVGVVAYVLSAPPDDPPQPKEKQPKPKKKKAEKPTPKTVADSSSSKTATPKKAGTSLTSSAKSTPSKSGVTMEDADEDGVDEIADPLARAVALKNKGNKYFKGGRYSQAVKCYSEAIDNCPKENKSDLSTFYQNRAAAYEQMNDCDNVLSDCNDAIVLNSRYIKALERRSRVQRKIAKDMEEKDKKSEEPPSKEVVERLKVALEDLTAVCILEGFQKQDHLMLVDTLVKEIGRSEARIVFNERDPTLTSKHFIQQYFMSFECDPVIRKARELRQNQPSTSQESQEGADQNGDGHHAVNGSVDEDVSDDVKMYKKVLTSLVEEDYDQVLATCEEALNPQESHSLSGQQVAELTLIRGTFYILSKQQKKAFADLNTVIDSESASPQLKSNALIKRASLYIQRCKDPEQDSLLSFADFQLAIDLDPENSDVYHHRGQVKLLTENTSEAIKDFEKSVELNPTFPIAYVQKLYTEYRAATEAQDQVKINNVVNSFEDAVAKFPDCVETYALFAQILCDQSQFDRAEELYVKAAKVDSTNANIFVHRGLLALQARADVNGARELIQKAIKVDPKCEFAYETLGTLEVQSGNLKVALGLFDKAIPLANTELEMAQICGLRAAASAQTNVSERLGIQLPTMMGP